MHIYSQWFVYMPIREVLVWLELIEHKRPWKKIQKDFIKIKDWKPSMPWICAGFVTLMPSIHTQHHNPNGRRLLAALQNHCQTCKISHKIKFWNHYWERIQSLILFTTASLWFTKHVPIPNTHQKAENRCTELKVFSQNCIHASWV